MNCLKSTPGFIMALFLLLSVIVIAEVTPAFCDLLDATDTGSTPASGDGKISTDDNVPLEEETTVVRTANGEKYEYIYRKWRVKEPAVEKSGRFAPARVDLLKLISEIEKIYRELLNRDPDPAGLDYWLEKVISGENTLETVRECTIDSEEYKALHSTAP